MSNIIDSIQLSGVTYDISGSGGVPESAFTAYTASTNSRISEDEEVTAAALNDLNESLSGKQETLVAGSGITISGNVISATGGGSITIDPSLDSGSTNAVANSAITNAFENINDRLSEDEEVTAAALNDLNERISGGSGNPTIELTQSQYDALVESGTVQSNTYYIITDASAGDLTQYWTSAQTNSAITEAVSSKASQTDLETVSGQVTTISGDVSTVSGQVANKQDTLVSGTNIKTINNQSLLGSGNIDIQGGGGGGGKAIEAGRGISITTGETADTVSFNLPISANSNNSVVMGGKMNSSFTNNGRDCLMVGSSLETKTGSDGCLVVGYNCSVNGDGSGIIGWGSSSSGDSSFAFGSGVKSRSSYSFAGGQNTTVNKSNSFAFGYSLETKNYGEASFGQYNNSVSASTTFGNSGNTLFSVGNGGSASQRHNAFEIRQNGDIYCSDGTNDVKLQDTITATAANTTALGGLKLVKLTQSEYDALSPNYDSNTLYVIT